MTITGIGIGHTAMLAVGRVSGRPGVLIPTPLLR
jgi:hypothetical protein